MKKWFESRRRSGNKTGSPGDSELISRLSRLEHRARPDYRRDLKNRLLESLNEQGPASYPHNAAAGKSRLFAWPVRLQPGLLVIGGLALVAALVLLVSILSAGLSAGQPLDSGTAAFEAARLTPLGGASPAARPSITSLQFYDPVSQSSLGSAEAEKTLGFAVRAPAYLPDGYRFESAALQASSGKPGAIPADFRGYLLRYTGPDGSARTAELEVSAWRLPKNFKLASSPSNFQAVSDEDVQRSRSQVIQGAAGYFIQGRRWSFQLVRQPGDSGEPGPLANGQEPAPPRGRSTPALSIRGPSPNRPGFSLDFGGRSDLRPSKSLIWQQNGFLNVVSGSEGLGDDELKRVAESLAVPPAGS